MRYEEVDDALINMFPKFVIDDIDEGNLRYKSNNITVIGVDA